MSHKFSCDTRRLTDLSGTDLEERSGLGKMEEGRRLKQATIWWADTWKGSSTDGFTTV